MNSAWPDAGSQPIEQRFVVGQTAKERLEQMGVRIRHARHQRTTVGVDNSFCLPDNGWRCCTGTDCGDRVANHVDPPGVVDRGGVVDGDDSRIDDQ